MEGVREPKGGQQRAMVKGAESEDVRLASGKKKKDQHLKRKVSRTEPLRETEKILRTRSRVTLQGKDTQTESDRGALQGSKQKTRQQSGKQTQRSPVTPQYQRHSLKHTETLPNGRPPQRDPLIPQPSPSSALCDPEGGGPLGRWGTDQALCPLPEGHLPLKPKALERARS